MIPVPPRWNFRVFGSAADPVRQSALSGIASQDGCPKRYRYERDAECAGIVHERRSAHWRPTLGTAVHETLRRALAQPVIIDRLLAGVFPPASVIDRVLGEELVRAAGGFEIDWDDASETSERASARAMVLGALEELHRRAIEIVAVEAPFRVELDGYVCVGTIDLVFRGREGQLVLLDWKTGGGAPEVVLEMGYQPAIYAHALEHGVLWPDETRELRLATYPAEIYIVQLREHAELARREHVLDTLRAKGACTSEDLAAIVATGWPMSARSVAAILTGLRKQSLVELSRRGRESVWAPAPGEREIDRETVWYRCHRTSDDTARLRRSLRTIVSGVRMGAFYETLGEHCKRCPFRPQCSADGYGPTDEDARAINAALRELPADQLSRVLPEAS